MRRLVLLAIGVLMFISPVNAREIIDMTGKKVSVPDEINEVFSGSPTLTYMIYAIDPGLVSGLNYHLRNGEKEYLNKKIQELPVLGGFYGQGNIANVEMILKTGPDMIMLWADKDSAISKNTEQMMMKNLPIPAVNVVYEDVADYGEAFLFLGTVLGKEEQGRKLKDYADETLKRVDDVLAFIPADKRPSVYYAEGTDGLNTDCDGSWHASLINTAGAENVYQCEPRDTYGMEKINMEQVMSFDPDVILVQEREFYDKIFKDPKWQYLKAVNTKRVYLIPGLPFNWFDRPPSFMRLIGIQWLMNNLYPDEYNVDMVKKVKEFFSLFLWVDKTDEEIRKVIYP